MPAKKRATLAGDLRRVPRSEQGRCSEGGTGLLLERVDLEAAHPRSAHRYVTSRRELGIFLVVDYKIRDGLDCPRGRAPGRWRRCRCRVFIGRLEIGEYETITRTYEERDGKEATIVISKSGTIIRKRRVTDNDIELLYQVDVKTHICRAGREMAPCENIKRDPDMERCINW